MFERFTDRARRIVVLATEEARQLKHNYIGTEHLLLAIREGGPAFGGIRLTGGGTYSCPCVCHREQMAAQLQLFEVA